MKLVFLDVDGVLNSAEFFRRKTPEIKVSICPALVAHVEALCTQADACIVVSSTWRLFYKMPRFRALMRERGLTAKIIGRTPEIPGADRGLEIDHWLRHSAKEAVTGVVILDDTADMAHLAPWHVLTTFDTGITAENVARALEVLQLPPPLATARSSP